MATKPVQQLPAVAALADADVTAIGQGASALKKATLAQVAAYVKTKIPQVTDGVDGNSVRYGDAPPVPEFGADGDFYINRVTHYVYGPKAGGAWPVGISMLGGATPLDDLIPASDPAAATVTRSAQKIAALLATTILSSAIDTDATFTANSDTRVPSQKAVKSAIANAVTGLLDFKGSIDGAGNPNYPAASKGDAYVSTGLGRAGGGAGASIDVGDWVIAIADNAGGTQAAVGASWVVLEHNLQGALLAANNLSDVANIATAQANLGVIGNYTRAAVDRAALAATATTHNQVYLREFRREGTWIWNGGNLQAFCTADATQAIYAAPTGQNGSTGAWVRKVPGPVNPEWWGFATINAAAANSDAVDAMFTTLSSRAVNVSGTDRGLEPITIPPGAYNLARTIDLTFGTTALEGTGTGMASGLQTLLLFPTGVTGIRVQHVTTSGATTLDGVGHFNGQGSIIRRLALRGAYATTLVEGEAHGIHLRARAAVEDVYIQQFEGDGFYVFANAGNGNANEWSANRVFVNNCRNGFYMGGSDANAGKTTLVDAENCRQWGIWDNSFLGNNHDSPSAAGCGARSQNDGVICPATIVSQSGNAYGVIYGQEVGASTNAPSGTTADNTWWYYQGVGAPATGRPAWFSGMAVRAGGSFAATGSSGQTVWVGAYQETFQGMAQFMSGSTPTKALVLGGMLTNGGVPALRGGVYLATGLGILTTGAFTSAWPGGTGKTELQGATGQFLRFYDSVMLPSRMFYGLNGGDILLQYSSSANSIMRYTGPSTTNQFGTGAIVPYATHASNLMVGDTAANARRITSGTAAPTTGAHAVGEFCVNTGATAGLIGWHCTVAGTPGTWEAVYSGYGVNKIGNITGAGGSVVQATSKATAVTKNTYSGQVTTNAAALAAGATVSFTLNNSQIAVDDEVEVWLKSGNATPGTYVVSVEGNGSGTRTIVIKNQSAGSLSEAIIIGYAVRAAAIA